MRYEIIPHGCAGFAVLIVSCGHKQLDGNVEFINDAFKFLTKVVDCYFLFLDF